MITCHNFIYILQDEMYPCSYAAAHYLKKMGYAGKVYLMSGSGTQYEIEAMGMKCIGVGVST